MGMVGVVFSYMHIKKFKCQRPINYTCSCCIAIVFDWFNLVAYARKSMHFDIISSIYGLYNRLYAHKEYANKELQLVMQVGNLHYERLHYIYISMCVCVKSFESFHFDQ